MKTSRMILCCIVGFLFFSFTPFGDGILHAAKVENQRWSFDFKNCTISDVLGQMTKVTGIDIFTNQIRDKGLFSKSYKDQSIDQILRDFFRKENCAMVWSYGDNGLDAIGVWILEGSGSRGRSSPTKFVKERGTGVRGSTIVKNVDHKSRVVRGEHQGARKSDPYSLQGESGDYSKDAKESFSPQYSKPAPDKAQTKPDSLGHRVSNRRISKATPASPSPMPAVANPGSNVPDGGIAQDEDHASGIVPPTPEKWHGLEPPPMPPGFSY